MSNYKRLVFFIILTGWPNLTFAADAFQQQLQAQAAKGWSVDQLPEAERDFVQKYMEAINSRNEAALRELVHPNVQLYMNGENSDYFDYAFSPNWGDSIPVNARISLSAITVPGLVERYQRAKEAGMEYPARPTHQLEIISSSRREVSVSDYSDSVSIWTIYLVKEGDGFFMTMPCPTDEGLSKWRQSTAPMIKFLVSALKDPLRAELKDLIERGMDDLAYRKYSQEFKRSIFIAKQVLSEFEPP